MKKPFQMRLDQDTKDAISYIAESLGLSSMSEAVRTAVIEKARALWLNRPLSKIEIKKALKKSVCPRCESPLWKSKYNKTHVRCMFCRFEIGAPEQELLATRADANVWKDAYQREKEFRDVLEKS